MVPLVMLKKDVKKEMELEIVLLVPMDTDLMETMDVLLVPEELSFVIPALMPKP